MQKKRVLLGFLLVAFALVACGPKTGPQYAPQEQAERNSAKWLHIWNAQFEDHVAMSQMPNLTNTQKRVLNKKADLLTQSKPLLDTYVLAVKGGGVPSATTEQQLMLLMNQLSQMAIGFTQ